MGEIVDLKRTPAADDQELVADLCRFSEGLLTEKQVKKRHKLAESTWDAYGNDEELITKSYVAYVMGQPSARRVRRSL
jgi:23S rRNA maturation-related 3'-5' exoribonuclease YhaM